MTTYRPDHRRRRALCPDPGSWTEDEAIPVRVRGTTPLRPAPCSRLWPGGGAGYRPAEARQHGTLCLRLPRKRRPPLGAPSTPCRKDLRRSTPPPTTSERRNSSADGAARMVWAPRSLARPWTAEAAAGQRHGQSHQGRGPVWIEHSGSAAHSGTPERRLKILDKEKPGEKAGFSWRQNQSLLVLRVAGTELVDSTCRIHQRVLAGVEGVAGGTHLHLDGVLVAVLHIARTPCSRRSSCRGNANPPSNP